MGSPSCKVAYAHPSTRHPTGVVAINRNPTVQVSRAKWLVLKTIISLAQLFSSLSLELPCWSILCCVEDVVQDPVQNATRCHPSPSHPTLPFNLRAGFRCLDALSLAEISCCPSDIFRISWDRGMLIHIFGMAQPSTWVMCQCGAAWCLAVTRNRIWSHQWTFFECYWINSITP